MIQALIRIAEAASAHDLARRHRLKVAFRFARVQLGSRLLRRPLVVPFVGATRIRVGAGQTGANGNYYFGLHEFADMSFVLHFLRRDDLFVDVGANAGSYTVLASGAVGARTVAFEPAPETLERLEANCRVNGLADTVTIRPVCAGNSSGLISFSTDGDTMNSVLRAGQESRPHVVVPVRRLDDELGDDAPLLIKIDAEGFDDDVLAGAVDTLSSPGPRALLIETLGGGAFGDGLDESEKRLIDLGYRRCAYDPWRRIVARSEARPSQNSLFVRDTAFAQARVASAATFDLNGYGAI